MKLQLRKINTIRILASIILRFFGRKPIFCLKNLQNRISLLAWVANNINIKPTKETVIIFANGRTGTHALSSAFPDSQFEEYGEYMNPSKKPFHAMWFPKNIPRWTLAYANLTCQKKGAIFMIKPEDLPHSFDFNRFFEQCANLGITLIFVHRDDIFAQARSKIRAKHFRTWNNRDALEAQVIRNKTFLPDTNEVISEALFDRILENHTFPRDRKRKCFNFISSENIFAQDFTGLYHQDMLETIKTQKMSLSNEMSPPSKEEIQNFFTSMKIPIDLSTKP